MTFDSFLSGHLESMTQPKMCKSQHIGPWQILQRLMAAYPRILNWCVWACRAQEESQHYSGSSHEPIFISSNAQTLITGQFHIPTQIKASKHSSYISFIVARTNLLNTCMRNTKWNSPTYWVVKSPISPRTSLQGFSTQFLNISKQSLRFVSYTLPMKHINMECKTMLLKVKGQKGPSLQGPAFQRS